MAWGLTVSLLQLRKLSEARFERCVLRRWVERLKIAVATASEMASPKAFVVFRGIKESIVKAARMGYDGIELALKTPDEIDPREIKVTLRENGLQCPAITTGQVFSDLDLYFTNPSLEKRKRVIRMFEAFIDDARFLDAMVNIGRVRGFIQEGETCQETKELFLNTLVPIEEHAREHGVTLILEPVNRYESNFVNNLDEAAELITEAHSPCLKLMPDLFHMNIEEASLERSLMRHKDLIAYVHLADSNRHAPGMGHLDFRSVIETLKRMNYQGWSSVEILPFPDPDTAALTAINYLRILPNDL